MGVYLNPGNDKFYKAINSEIYVDKTELIQYTNRVFNTMQQNVCVSRPRRFGKSMTANMLAAYYSRGCQSAKLFDGLKIKEDLSFPKYLNKYNVFFINMQEFLSRSKTVEKMVLRLNRILMRDLKQEYPDVDYFDEEDLAESMQDVYQQTGCPFVIIIDEWDALIRDETASKKVQDEYINFLRGIFKGTEPTKYIQLVYLTGILPIKKEKTQSALNNFDEFTMLDAGVMAPYIGFTEAEVKDLCERYHRDFEKVKYWYDGYLLEDYQVYNPKAVVSVCVRGRFRSYWSETASYEAIVPFINMNYDGLKNAIIEILSGASIKVNTAAFKNDTVNIQSKDDVLTYLIHLGYLGYNQNRRTAFVPNEEIRQELTMAVESRKWNEMITFQQESEHLLEATLDMDEEAVEEGIEKIHTEYVSNIQYNNENSLSSVLAIAYLSSMEYYFKPVRELPTGRGFADFVFIPKPEYVSSYPALVVELKWNKNVKTALQQIKEKQYPDSVLDYTGDILLVEINYDKKTKEHQCLIEKYEKL